jgi:PAS domain S-box-containing protein
MRHFPGTSAGRKKVEMKARPRKAMGRDPAPGAPKLNAYLIAALFVALGAYTVLVSLWLHYFVAIGFLVLLVVAGYYGLWTIRQMRHHAQERARYVRRLRYASARTRSILDTAADGILTVDEAGVIKSLNRAAARIFGYPRREVLGQPLSLLLSPHPSSMVGTGEAKVLGSSEELVGTRKDGSKFPVEPAISKVRLGKRARFTYVVRDLTERRRAEEALRQARDELEARVHERTAQLAEANAVLQAEIAERQRAQAALEQISRQNQLILQAAGEGILGLDRDERITFVNPAAATISGWRPAELIGERLDATLYPPDPTAMPPEPVATGALQRVEDALFRRRDEFWFPVQYIRTPIREGGAVVGAVITFQDITERKEAQERLRSSEERYRCLVDLAPDAIFIYRSGRVVFVNPVGCKLLGADGPGPIVGRSLVDLAAAESRGPLQDCLRRLVEHREPFAQMELRLRGCQGEVIDVEVSASTFQDQGVQAVQAVFRDIRERKRTELALRDYADRLAALSRQLLQTQELERRHLARELHDEIGQTLTAIKLNLQAARRGCSGPMEDEQRKTVIARIDENISIVDKTIGEVRNLSLDLRPSLLDDLGLTPALRWYVERQGERAGFTTSFDADLEERLPPDLETVCFRVVQEAVTNAARHARPEHVSVMLCQENGAIELAVRDDGAGFDVAAARERASRGESLGLLGMQERARLAGGTIDIRSAPGEGTEIRITLPAPPPDKGVAE